MRFLVLFSMLFALLCAAVGEIEYSAKYARLVSQLPPNVNVRNLVRALHAARYPHYR